MKRVSEITKKGYEEQVEGVNSEKYFKGHEDQFNQGINLMAK